jgi:diguanylate cyclase (GGDEF)-like protein/PAS domain S-box-containing protein
MNTSFEKFANDRENMWELFQLMNDGLMITDFKQQIIAVNPSFEKITGYRLEEVTGKNPKFLQSGKTDPFVFQEMWNSLFTTGTWTGELVNRRKSGELFWSYITITKINKAEPKDSYYIGIMRDITERKQMEDKMQHMAYHDSLTQLPNRALFLEKLKDSITNAEHNDKKLALLFLDLDKFKLVNDTFGHLAGDELLLQVSRKLQHVIGIEGIVGRFGGDEFTILLDNIADSDDVNKVTEKIFRSFNVPVDLFGKPIKLSASIGATIYPDHGITIEMLLKNADKAMYFTKNEEKNSFFLYDKKINAPV